MKVSEAIGMAEYFGELSKGDGFLYDGEAYMKTADETAVRIHDGEVVMIMSKVMVIPVHMEVIWRFK